MDNRQGMALVLIDCSAAFDTVNHKIMIQRLCLHYGIVGKVLGWYQRVVIRDASSSTTCLTSGVLKGSVLGPLLFSLYVQPIGDIIRAYGLCFHHYMDDLQLYCHFDLTATVLGATLRRMEDCLDVVKQWMTSNCLCMNDNKMEYLPKMVAALIVDSVTCVGDATITASRYVHNLGVIIDRHLDFKKQVSSSISVCAFHLRHINQMSRCLPTTTKERVINAIITSWLDYCNSLLYGTTVNNIARLQRMHNLVARLILRRSRSDNATPQLCILHWLPVACRIDVKLSVFTYKAVSCRCAKIPVRSCVLIHTS